MTTAKRIKRPDKGKKKTAVPSRAKSRPKVSGEVCVLEDIVMTERLYCCDDECCCAM